MSNLDPTTEQQHILNLFRDLLEEQSNGCVEFIGPRLSKGYGTFKKALAHRFAWEMANGSIPKGLCVLHKCDNPPCCNIDHLFIGTYLDNARDKIAKGRDVPRFGQYNGRAILTDDKVREIHYLILQGLSTTDIATRYKVTVDNIRSIRSGFSWKHIYKEFHCETD